MPDKGEMGQHRSGGDDLGAGDANPGIGLLRDAGVNVGGAARRSRRDIPVDRRLDQRVVDKGHALLAVAVPAARIILVRGIKFGIGSQGREKGRLVVGRPTEPAIGQPRPGCDRVAAGHQLSDRTRRDKIPVGEPSPFGRAGQQIFLFRMITMQRVVEPGDHPRRVAERRVIGDVFDALAVDPHLSPVVQAVQKFLAGIGKQAFHV